MHPTPSNAEYQSGLKVHLQEEKQSVTFRKFDRSDQLRDMLFVFALIVFTATAVKTEQTFPDLLEDHFSRNDAQQQGRQSSKSIKNNRF
jgi:hypothetical protein